MAEEFDAYHQWLGIKQKDQPPNHYRLLAIEVFEDDPNVIENAADQRMAHIRNFQSGPHGAESQRILNEISSAKVCLLNAERKAKYDEKLRAKLAETESKQTQRQTRAVRGTPLPKAEPAAKPVPEPDSPIPQVAPQKPGSATRKQLARRRRSTWQSPMVLGVGALALVGLIGLGVMLGSGGRNPKPEVETTATRGQGDTPGIRQAASPEQDLWHGEDDQSDTQKPPEIEPPTVDSVEAPTPDPSLVAANDQPPERVDPPSSDPQPMPPTRLAVPSAEDRESTLSAVKETFSEQYGSAKEPEQLAALAEEFVKLAGETEDDATLRFVLLDEARRLLIAGFAVDRALAMSELIATDYDVARWELTSQAIAGLGESAGNKAQRMQLVPAVQSTAEEAAEDGAFSEALAMLEVAAKLAQRSREYKIANAARSRSKEITQVQELHQAAQQARETLASDESNADAHSALGFYLCFIQENWQEGLPHLARGGDSDLSALAEQDLSQSAGADAQVAIADAWILWAKTSGDHALAARRRAYHWYLAPCRGCPASAAARRAASGRTLQPRGSAGNKNLAAAVGARTGGTDSRVQRARKGLQRLGSLRRRTIRRHWLAGSIRAGV